MAIEIVEQLDDKDQICILMDTNLIEDIELEVEEFPLRWIAPVYNEDYDYQADPLELDEDYECSGSNSKYMISLQNEIVITKNDDDSYTYEDGLRWVESHVWCKEIDKSTPGTLPWYIEKRCNNFQELLDTLEQSHSFDMDQYEELIEEYL